MAYVDPQQYWSGTGYGQIPASTTGFENPNYVEKTNTWSNANTYAPWTNSSLSQQPGYAPQQAPKQSLGYLGLEGKFGENANSFGDFMHILSAWDFKGGKKRPTYTFYAPSYQGTPFTPEEGFPQYYSTSPEVQNQTQQELLAGQNAQAQQQQQDQLTSSFQNALSSLNFQGGYDYNYGGGNPNYVGQQENQYGSYYGANKGLYNTFVPGK